MFCSRQGIFRYIHMVYSRHCGFMVCLCASVCVCVCVCMCLSFCGSFCATLYVRLFSLHSFVVWHVQVQSVVYSSISIGIFKDRGGRPIPAPCICLIATHVGAVLVILRKLIGAELNCSCRTKAAVRGGRAKTCRLSQRHGAIRHVVPELGLTEAQLDVVRACWPTRRCVCDVGQVSMFFVSVFYLFCWLLRVRLVFRELVRGAARSGIFNCIFKYIQLYI